MPSGPAAFDGLSLLNSLRVCSLVQTKCELLPNAFLFYMIGAFAKLMSIKPVVKFV